MIDLNNKRFRGQSNSSDGEVDSATIFHYYQDGPIIWGQYAGGTIVKGTLTGVIIDRETFHFNYNHVNNDSQLLSGYCHSVITKLDSGKLKINESWKWSGGKAGEGQSIIIEI